MMKPLPFKIAIVGLGPKGLYGFERILAQLKAHHVQETIEIHLFNKTHYMGSGDVYRSDQPDYLLMNFSHEHIQMWPDEAPPPVVKNPLSFSEYLMQEQHTTPENLDPLYASRGIVGAYLEKGFEELCQNLPENVILHQNIAEVRTINKTGEHYTLDYKPQGRKHHLEGFQNILITTGHQRHKICCKPRQYHIPFIYPVQETLKDITHKDTVAVKGLGLTFIDAILALTEGRGGKFTETTNGNFSYTTSGKEPKHIFPYSKSGWPMLPKYTFEVPDNEPALYIDSIIPLTDKVLSFKKHILPLLHQDMEYAYYSSLFAHEKKELPHYTNYKKVKTQITAFHKTHPEYPEFSLEELLEPDFDPDKTTHQNVVAYLTAFTTEDNLDIEHEAQLRAAAVWTRVCPVFNNLYSFSGLDPASHQEFDKHYFGKLNRIAYGPPPENLKKIIALAEAGIVNFRFAKSPHTKHQTNCFTLSNGSDKTDCDVLIDARIPKNSLEKEASGLFLSLCGNQLARPYVNRGKHTTYALGTVEINHNGNLINTHGEPENITLYGTPTEGLVHDNDTLSRTRNNFAGPWAEAIIKQLTKRTHETNSQTSTAVTHTQ
ncbi:MAG: FAD/NAD(P)-binding protein [Flavobacteriaceae bacterium]